MKKSERKEKLKSLIKYKGIIILILLLIFNSYAWFIFINTVRSGVELRVKKWDISFSGETTTDTYVTISIDNICPGMSTQTNSVDVNNNGEIDADITYEIVSLRCFENNYSTLIGDNQITQSELNTYISDLPFTIDILSTEVQEDGSTIVSDTISYGKSRKD